MNSILLFGGSSDERMVSVASAQNLVKTFSFREIFFIDPSGVISPVEKAELLGHERPFEIQFKASQKKFAASLTEFVEVLAKSQSVKENVVFLGLHGTEGEDGTLQQLLETFKIPFTGSGAKASALCFDKTKTKHALKASGLRLAEQIVIPKNDKSAGELLSNFYKNFGALVVKPIASGSSFGLQIVKRSEDLRSAAEMIAASPYSNFMAEAFVEGRELTVGVLQNEDGTTLNVLPPSEVVLAKDSSFDYQGKYLGRGTTEITPADLNEIEKAQAQKMALSAHKILGCFGYSRTDMILTKDGPVFLETNTLPGLSGASFIPQQLHAANLSLNSFVENQLKLAQKRYLLDR